jgi:hypothetical protein
MRRKIIEDGRARTFWWVENRAVDEHWIAYVGVYAWAIYCVLVRDADDTGRSFPSAQRIASLTGVSLREVRYGIKVLISSGLVRKVKKGGPTTTNVYQVRLPETKNAVAPKRTAGTRKPKASPPPPAPAPDAAPDPARAFLASLDEDPPATETRPAPTPAAKRATAAKRRKLPTAWAPNETHHKMAAEEGVDLEREVTGFRDHAEATGRVMLDWDAAFRTWLRNARAFSRDHYRQPGKGRQTAEQAARDEVLTFYENEEVV